MKGHGEKISRKMDAAILALLQEPTIEKAAARSGVSEVTLWRWQQMPEFQEQYQAARKKTVEVALGQLQQASVEAVDVLRDVMKTACKSPSARVSAARTILEMAQQSIDLEEMLSRLTKIEQAYSKFAK